MGYITGYAQYGRYLAVRLACSSYSGRISSAYAFGDGRLAGRDLVLRMASSGDDLVTRKNYVRRYVWSWY